MNTSLYGLQLVFVTFDSSVVQRWATGWMIGGSSPAGAGNFSLQNRVQTGSGAHTASYPMGTRGSFPVVERPGREADHSPPSSAEVKNARSYTSIPQHVFMACCLINTPGLDVKVLDVILWTNDIARCMYENGEI
jgi:hypothetical protein